MIRSRKSLPMCEWMSTARYLLAPLIASSLLAGCQISQPSAERRLDELQGPCVDGGHAVHASTVTCTTSPTPTPHSTATLTPQPTRAPTAQPTAATASTPMPAHVVDWLGAFVDLQSRVGANNRAMNDLQERIVAAREQPSAYLDEIRELRNDFSSADGPYGFRTRFPRFPDVRVLNERISAWAESALTAQDLYIRYLETGELALYDQADELRIASNAEWRAIQDVATGFLLP